MVKYEFIVRISGGNINEPDMKIVREFENDYSAKNELTNMGRNGFIYENLYYPPHKIVQIEFNKIVG